MAVSASSGAASSPFVGREAIALDLEAFLEKQDRRRPAVAFIRGIPGAGKSTLARHSLHRVTNDQDWLFSFKYDQFNAASPASFFVHALEDVAARMEHMPPRECEEVRRLLVDAVSPNAQLLSSLCPQLGGVLGPQPALIPLAPQENQIRLSFVLRKAVAVMTRRFRRVVLYVDDLQWADAATMTVLSDLVADASISNLSIIACYRTMQAENAGLLRRTIRVVGNPLFDEEVGSFEEGDIAALLGQRLGTDEETARKLAAEIRRSTNGTPLEAMNILELLLDEQASAVDAREFDLGAALRTVAAVGAQPDGYNLVAKRLARLDRDAQDLLTMSAYVGDRIDVPLLAELSGDDEASLRATLDRLAEQGIVDEVRDVYVFAHDTLQRAAYERETDLRARRSAIRLAAARVFEERFNESGESGWLFRAVTLFNQEIDAVTSPAQRAGIARLNRKATRAALDSGDANRALDFANAGLSVTPEDSWQTDHKGTMQAHLDAAEAAYLVSDITRFDALIDAAAEQARSPEDWAGAYMLRLQQKVSTVQYEEALDIAVQMLDRLGQPLPRRANKAQVGISFARTMMLLRGRSMDDLFELPHMSDARAERELETLMLAASAAYFAEPNLFPLIVFRMVGLSVEHGNSRLSAFGWVCYGLAQCAVVGNVKAGYDYGMLALRLTEDFKADDLRARVHMLFNTFVRHWSESRAKVAEHLREGEVAGLASGDLEFATYCGWHRCNDAFWSGTPLSEVEEMLAEVLAVAREYNQHKVAFLLSMMQDFLTWLKTPGAPVPDDAAHDAFCEEHKDYTSLCYVKMFQALRFLLSGDPKAALRATATIDEQYEALQGQFYVPYYLTLKGLAAAQVGGAAHRVKVWNARRKLAAWAKRGAADLEPLAALMRPTEDWVRGRSGDAVAGFDSMISRAQGGEVPVWCGVLAAKALTVLHESSGSTGQAEWARDAAERLTAIWGVAPAEDIATEDQTVTLPSVMWRADYADRESWMQRVCQTILSTCAMRDMTVVEGEAPDELCLLHARQDGERFLLDLSGDDPPNLTPARQLDLKQPDGALLVFTLAGPTGQPGHECTEQMLSAALMPLVGELRRDATQRKLRQVEDQRVALQTAYGRFIPGYLLTSLGHSDVVDIRVGDYASHNMTVMFCDMRGATGIMEKIGAKASLELFNELFIAIESEVLRAGGYIDNFLGDAVLALFDAAPEICLDAAVGVAHALERAQQEMREKGMTAPGFGLGLSSGEVVVGAVGGLNQIRMGAIGDTLNLASRLESLTKRYGTAALVPDDIAEHVDKARLRQVDHVIVVGRKTPVRLFEVIDALPEARATAVSEHAALYEEALNAYYAADFARTCDALDRFLEKVPEDVPATRLRSRAARFRDADPGPDWSAIHALKEK